MEDYKKLYEDLLERIKQMANAQPEVTKTAIEILFPELALEPYMKKVLLDIMNLQKLLLGLKNKVRRRFKKK